MDKKADMVDSSTILIDDVNEETKDNNNLIIEQENLEEIVPIVSEASKWTSDIAEKGELFDFNKDNVDEILLMFDTRGGGGEGTHEIYVLWIGANDIEVMLLDSYVKGVENKVLPYNIDGVYSLEKIEYQGKIRLLTRQYMWGENGHSDRVGDLLFIIDTLDAANEAFTAEETWVAP